MSLDPKQINQFDETPDQVLRGSDVIELEREISAGVYKNEKKTLANFFIPDGFGGYIEAVTARSYVVILSMPFDGVIEELRGETETGSVAVKVQIGAVDVVGAAITATDSESGSVATSANVFVKGNRISIVLSGLSGSPAGLNFMILFRHKIVRDA